MLYYILQIIAFQLVFLLIYDLFLKKETFFNWNRIYLIGTAILSFALPFLRFEVFKTIAPKDFVIRLPEVIIGEITPLTNNTNIILRSATLPQDTSTSIWTILFLVGFGFAMLFLAFKLGKLYWLKLKYPNRWKGDVLLVNLLNSSMAFSFFNTIYVGSKISVKDYYTVINHELIHVRQKHSLDIIFFEILKVVMWFNPCLYIYQNRVQTLHEYIADELSLEENGKEEYYNSLLNQIFETQNLSLVNTFYKPSLIKKRIAMLQKSKSNRIKLLKYVLLIPLVFGMLIYTSLDVKAQEKEVEEITETIALDQELTYEELVKKYLEELNERKLKGEEFATYYKKYIPPKHVFKRSLHEHARSHAFMRFMMENDYDQKGIDEIMEKQQSYSEYLEWIKTDKAKMIWELTSRDGVQHLFVEDIQNYTEEEQARYDKKMELLLNDYSWHTLIATDGEKTFRVSVNSEENEQHNEAVGSMEAVVVENISESIEVPFSVIENPPTFKKCETSESAEERRDCLSKGIAIFVNKNFNTDLAKELGLSGRQRISVFFKVGRDGNIHSISARAPHPDLEDEAKRVIRLLPQLVPGTQKGKPVTVPYSLPILFQVQDTSSSSNGLSKDGFDQLRKEQLGVKNQDSSIVTFANIDVAPAFESCKELEGKERKDCTSMAVAMFVNKNFNMDLASSLGLTGRQRISLLFQISKEGAVENVIAEAVHPALVEESKRVIMSLPKMIPGEHNGKTVVTSLSLPILFQVNASTKDKN